MKASRPKFSTSSTTYRGNSRIITIDERPDVLDGYITGLGRDVPAPRIAHLYKGDFAEPGDPMCRFGWNRDDGQSYSIWRGNVGRDGVCKVCMRRARAGLEGVAPPA